MTHAKTYDIKPHATLVCKNIASLILLLFLYGISIHRAHRIVWGAKPSQHGWFS